VSRGEAVRIMTGAPVPEGADGVVRVEDTRAQDDRAYIFHTLEVGDNIRPKGEDMRAGEVVLAKESAVGPPEVGLMASVGRSHALVYQRPRVAILATGNELADLGDPVTPNKIMNSNGYAVAAQVLEAGGIPVVLGIAEDRPEALQDRLEQGRTADVIVISGGVSVGAYDFVKDVLERMGVVLTFWKVAMKPGEPLAFGTLGTKLVFGLPGNPVSTMVTFEQFVRPSLRKMQGHTLLFRTIVEAVLMERITKRPGKMHFVRVSVKKNDGRYEVRTTGNQSSGVLTSMSRADGLLIFPTDATQMEKGETVKVQFWEKSLSNQPELGF